MSKQDEVYQNILDKSLKLFNTNGIHITSIQDIMNETGLPKGAIYRRFKNKSEIVLASYKKAGLIIDFYMRESIKNKDSFTEKIIAISNIYLDAVDNPPIEGGCPMLNTAIESDNNFPELKKMMAEAFQQMILFVESLLQEGIESGEYTTELEPRSLASHLLSSMEGAIMTSRLSLNNEHVENTIKYTERLLLTYTR
ncbi:TetR/AcrR family transcriptional regulator [Thalassobacillus pellis]|uniref:TetR/AcrR family transcriptional regulator n=1 Tax=Thalassobacillus pellis TaxID=748008 RepID=UPI0019610063|nr:TetR/AcrR family transcriptional regulator [Thalassobacillus pellis]MBM7553957.1 AcrR family transcriptional regulator [Thalassobacillus pellis]